MGIFTDYRMTIAYLAVIALFIAGLLLARKYLIKKLNGVKNGRYIKIIDSLAVAQDKRIILLEAGNKILIVGVSLQRMETIAEFSKEEFGDISAYAEEAASGGGAFGGNFLSLLKKKLNNKDSGKK